MNSLTVTARPGTKRAPMSTASLFGRYAAGSPMLPVTPLIAAFCALYALLRQPAGVRSGMILSASLMTGLVIVGPACAGVGAWLARRERRWGLAVPRRLSVRPGSPDLLLELAAAAALAFAAYFVAVIVSAIWLYAAGHAYGGLSWWPLSASFLAVVVQLCLGYRIGQYLPYTATAPVVAVAALVLAMFTSSAYGTWWTLFFPVTEAQPVVFDVWHGGTFLVQAAWFAALLALLAALIASRRNWTKGIGLAVGLSLLLVITTAVALQPFHGRWLAPGADSFRSACIGAAPQICVHPAFASTLMELPGLYGPIMSKLESTPAGVTRLEQRPRGIDGAASPGALPISFDNAAAGTLDASVVEFINNLLKLDCYTAAGAKAQPWETVVADWLEGDLDGGQPLKDPFANAAAAQWFSGLTPSGRHTWFVAHYSAFTNCTLSKTDFGS